MAKKLNQIIIIDLEATCWEKDTDRPEKEVQEIIEIGICLLDTKSGEITKNKGILIKPSFSTISPFCEKLTTITKDLLDQEGVSYPEALDLLQKEYSPYEYTWASYGDFDREMFRKNDELYKTRNSLGKTHLNVKNLFALKNSLSREVGMSKALNILNLPLEGVHHRGFYDVQNISRILWSCLKK